MKRQDGTPFDPSQEGVCLVWNPYTGSVDIQTLDREPLLLTEDEEAVLVAAATEPYFEDEYVPYNILHLREFAFRLFRLPPLITSFNLPPEPIDAFQEEHETCVWVFAPFGADDLLPT